MSAPASEFSPLLVPDARPERFPGLRRLLGDPQGLAGLILVALFLTSALFAHWLAPYDPNALDVRARLGGPSLAHLAGTDQLGRDTFSRVLYGGRVALQVAFWSISVSLIVGILLGMLAGYGPRWLDSALLLLFDTLRSFPTIMFALAAVTLAGPSLEMVILILIVTSVPVYGRIVRTQTLSLKATEFILAERALGAGAARILSVHVLPNLIGPLLILASMDVPVVVTVEAGLSFLGLGVRPPTPSWGNILSDGYAFIRSDPLARARGRLSPDSDHARLHLPRRGPSRHLRPQAPPDVLMADAPDHVLEIRDLSIDFATPRGRVHALRHASLAVPRHRIVGVVGESGSGKTTLVLAALALLPENALVTGGEVIFEGKRLLTLAERDLRELRGQRLAAVFQDPMSALNPVLSIRTQMVDIQFRERVGTREKRARAVAMLQRVGIPDPDSRIDDYPHQLSGGMRQRVAIAMALLGRPDLLIADEPTTALDVTLEAQIIHLLRELRRDFAGSILFVSHNLGLIAELCDQVVVMYAGEVVEEAGVFELFHRPAHPYTQALLACDPAAEQANGRELATIPGEVPDLIRPAPGCVFAPRCARAHNRCRQIAPGWSEVGDGHRARCHLLAGS